MPFLLAKILNFQGSAYPIGAGGCSEIRFYLTMVKQNNKIDNEEEVCRKCLIAFL